MTRVYEPGEKDHRQEIFPVASALIRKKHRPAILAFYRFARAADDVADHPTLPEAQKLSRLDAFEATLLGAADSISAALPLRQVIAERCLPVGHALDLLRAFRQDVWKTRYESWEELMGYCACSAAPVGRFVLELHGEDAGTWPASDGLCAALQIINHLQDCQIDYLRLNRIYIPQDFLARHGVFENALAAPRASPDLRACFMEMTRRTHGILMPSPLSMLVRDNRLALEVSLIERLAERLLRMLLVRDPFSERVHVRKTAFIPVMAEAICLHVHRRFRQSAIRQK